MGVNDKNLCEIRNAFILAINEQYEDYITKKDKVLLKYNLSDFRDMLEDFGINGELTEEEMKEIISNDGFLLEVAEYTDIEDEFTSKEPNRNKVMDVVQQWVMVADIIKSHEEQEKGMYEYPEDFTVRISETTNR